MRQALLMRRTIEPQSLEQDQRIQTFASFLFASLQHFSAVQQGRTVDARHARLYE
jgi:hypothetical protein